MEPPYPFDEVVTIDGVEYGIWYRKHAVGYVATWTCFLCKVVGTPHLVPEHIAVDTLEKAKAEARSDLRPHHEFWHSPRQYVMQ